jgi:outer membrane protein OmpA-like peptidoglycan-associated protein
MIMKNQFLPCTPTTALKFTQIASLMVLLAGCASPATADRPVPLAEAGPPASLQAQRGNHVAAGQLVPVTQKVMMSSGQMLPSQDTAGAQRSQADMAQHDARIAGLESDLNGLGAKRTDSGMVLTLGDRLFRHGQLRLSPGHEHNVAKLADFFKQHPEVKASINGYSDNAGSFETNFNLSQGRAEAIAGALETRGVPAASLSTHAYGQIGWIASNTTAQGRLLNRRVEIVFDLAADTPSTR